MSLYSLELQPEADEPEVDLLIQTNILGIFILR